MEGLGKQRVFKCLACKRPDKNARKPFFCQKCTRTFLDTNQVFVICEQCTRHTSIDFDTFDARFGQAMHNVFPNGIPREPGWVMTTSACPGCSDGEAQCSVQMHKIPSELLPS